ncbi:MAG: T9SS type A sorting domain-containing protein, partial [Bacteroidales bacterium]|nr:T9SS type A sorting domain-containing protein [Bacteroidales bacterium]
LKFLLNSHGYITDFVGSESSGCAFFSDCQHAGFGGTMDQYILRLLQDGWITYYDGGWVSKYAITPSGPYLDVFSPDIILLHIGTNDITHEGDAALTNQKITAILDMVDQYETRANKEVIVFVALIINRVKPWGTKATQTTAFNNGIKTLVQNRITAGDKLVIVDMENDAGFVYSYTVDMANDGQGLHPNETGYSKMAALWYAAIEANYNTAPVISEIPDQSFDEGTSSNVLILDDYVNDLQDPDESITWTVEQIDTSNLNITIDANKQVVATPKDPEWSGSQIVVFTATDLGRNGKYIKSDTDTVVFTITPVNDPPVITSTPETEVLVGNEYYYTLTCEDIDNPSVALSAVTKPLWLNFSTTTGVLTGTPEVSNQGINQVTLQCSDGLLSTDQVFLIDVKNPDALYEIKNAGFSIYPVPAQKYLMIVSENFKTESVIEVISFFGTILKRLYLPSGKIDYQLDLEEFENGLYYIHLVNESKTYFSKFIVIN